ncbi:hypothetical protein Ddye_025663 [Dipteronia dyeriana]|uniref:Uncharacterized protein n=1 Tax=Dipteronia dyeriana TaxID=168575 RepID=A0AAD9TLL5_9ROSI|nr:hypothetical protein Ddye_025663 [Dipteronia dyeriana]
MSLSMFGQNNTKIGDLPRIPELYPSCSFFIVDKSRGKVLFHQLWEHFLHNYCRYYSKYGSSIAMEFLKRHVRFPCSHRWAVLISLLQYIESERIERKNASKLLCHLIIHDIHEEKFLKDACRICYALPHPGMIVV